MSALIKHKFNCTKPESADITKVRTSNWNDEHYVSGIVLSVNGLEPDTDGNVEIQDEFNTDIALIYQTAKL